MRSPRPVNVSVGREGEGCNTWRREGVLADQGTSVWVGPGEARQASQTHPEILTSCRGSIPQVGPRSILVAAEEVSMSDRRESWSRREFVSGLTLAGTAGVAGIPPSRVGAEPPPHTTRLRLYHSPSVSLAPPHIVGELLKAARVCDPT